jgi:hypothetical protein
LLSSPERVPQSPRIDGSNGCYAIPAYPDFKKCPDDSKRPVLLQTHPGSERSGSLLRSRLVCSTPDATTREDKRPGHHVQKLMPLKSPTFTADLLSLHPASTECASSSQCQISEDREQPTKDKPRVDLIGLPSHSKERTNERRLSNETDQCIGSFFRTLRTPRSREPRPSSRGPAWWSQTGSNRRPHACKARALPTELWPL